MRHHRKKIWLSAGALWMTLSVAAVQTEAAGSGSLLTIDGRAEICAMEDGSGKYLLKSNAFYCLDENGAFSQTKEIHYFENFEIDGIVLNGYYYHDETGEFEAASPHMEFLTGLSAVLSEEEEASFDGYYMVGNLGKLTAAPQVRYMDQLQLNGQSFDGYYYFDENGRMDTQPGIHFLSMTCNGQSFDGYYYFGEGGKLVQEETLTEDGFVIDAFGKVTNTEELGMGALRTQLRQMVAERNGTWSIYLKELSSGDSLIINNRTLFSASLIKVFAMACAYENMEQVKANEAKKMNADPASPAVEEKIDALLRNMITVSDNESFNELVRLQSENNDFSEGAQQMNEFLEAEGYSHTSVQHTLSPSSSPETGLGGRNITSAGDCGKLLEKIYNGECVNEEASEAMLELLLAQRITTKIPSGITGDVKIANKTGETDTDQHDIAIVYGEGTTYILCILSEDCPESEAVTQIRELSGKIYNYLNRYQIVEYRTEEKKDSDTITKNIG